MTLADLSIPRKIDQLFTLREVVDLTNLSRATIYRMISAGQFPEPVKIGRLSRWLASDIANYLENLAAAKQHACDQNRVIRGPDVNPHRGRPEDQA